MTFGYEVVLKMSLIGTAALWLHPILDLASFINYSMTILWTLFDFGGLYKSTGYMIHCFLNKS
jgi:hypothetical protein